MHQNLKRFSVVVIHRRGGKTVFAVNTIIDAAIRFPRRDGRFAYFAPQLKQAKQIAWDYFKQFTKNLPGRKVNESELSITLSNGARIRLYGMDNPDAARGIYLDGAVLDEYGDMKANAWGEVIYPTLADRQGWALFIGTPKGMNQFHEVYHRALANPNWYAAMMDVNRTEALPESELELARTTMSENEYRQEFLCDWSASQDDVLITIDMVERAIKRAGYLREEQVSLSPLVIGVDVARFGDDRSVVIKRQGLKAFDPEVFSGIDNMELASRLAFMMQKKPPDAVFIDAGRGEGVIDRLRQLGFQKVIEANAGHRPGSDRYLNKRAEMWDEMRDWIKQGGAIPDHPQLRAELAMPTYGFNMNGKMKLESKEDIKKRGLKSPDVADALALTFYQPIASSQNRIYTPNGETPTYSHQYDPFERKYIGSQI